MAASAALLELEWGFISELLAGKAAVDARSLVSAGHAAMILLLASEAADSISSRSISTCTCHSTCKTVIAW